MGSDSCPSCGTFHTAAADTETGRTRRDPDPTAVQRAFGPRQATAAAAGGPGNVPLLSADTPLDHSEPRANAYGMTAPETSGNIVSALIREAGRVGRLCGRYDAIGEAGAIAAAMMVDAMTTAEITAADGDLVEMIKALEQLRGFTA